MPIRRKVCKIGTSFAVFLPKTWISLLEEKHGKVEAVTMEVNGQLVIKPILNTALSNPAMSSAETKERHVMTEKPKRSKQNNGSQ